MAARRSSLIEKISDYLQTRDKQTNFGECRRCDKKVYWSTSKVASHVRSGHCTGATEEEVKLFKQDFVYDSPKNLVHKSTVTKRLKEAFEIEEYQPDKSAKTDKDHIQIRSKRMKVGVKSKPKDDTDDELAYEQELVGEDQVFIITEDNATDYKEDVEIENLETVKAQSVNFQKETTNDDKFIQVVYPQFKGKTKLELIEDILDLKRQNELLQLKAKTYKNTINRLLK